MKMWAELEAFKGHLVKVVFRDGDKAIAKRGELVSVTDEFIELHTFENAILIRVSEVLKVQRSLNHNQGGRPKTGERVGRPGPPSTIKAQGKGV